MTGIRISNAPRELRDVIWHRKLETFEEHRKRQPFAFPRNYADLIVKRTFGASLTDAKGKPLAQSPNIFCAYVDDEFCGYVELSSRASAAGRSPAYVNIDDIWVDPRFRDRGIGRALLGHVKSLCRERNWDNLTATVYDGNDRSAKLFRAAGFAV